MIIYFTEQGETGKNVTHGNENLATYFWYFGSFEEKRTYKKYVMSWALKGEIKLNLHFLFIGWVFFLTIFLCVTLCNSFSFHTAQPIKLTFLVVQNGNCVLPVSFSLVKKDIA